MDKILYDLLPYFTVENGLIAAGVFVAFSILMFFIKQLAKLLVLIVLFGVAYYFFLATPIQKKQVETCVLQSIETKEIHKSCKTIL